MLNVSITSEILDQDTGLSPTDFITQNGALTLAGTVSDSAASVDVYDTHGGAWTSLLGAASVDGSGRWTYSTVLGEGSQTLVAKAANAGEHATSAPAQTVVVDTNALVASVDEATMVSTFSVTSQPYQTISGWIAGGAPEGIVTFSEGNAILGTAAVRTDGTWAGSFTLSGDGVHTILARAVDVAGNIQSPNWDLPLRYTLDTTVPTVTITSAGGLTNASSVTISGTVNLSDAGSSIQIFDNGVQTSSTMAGSDGTWSYRAAFAAEGLHTFAASVTDRAGNTGTSNTVQYAIDRTPPHVAIANPGGTTNEPTHVVSGTVDPSQAGSNVHLSDNGVEVGTALVGFDGSWSRTLTFSGEGQHLVTAADTDAAGNTGTGSAQCTLDTTAPAVTITSAGGATSEPVHLISGKEIDSHLGSHVHVFDNGIHVADALVGADGSWSQSLTFSGNGDHRLSANATDAAGNFGTSAVVTFDLEPAQPASSVEHANNVFRFYDTVTHDHFYTQWADEKAGIQATMPHYVYEGAAWATPDKGAGTLDVFRFYDQATGAHFFTTSAEERDYVVDHYHSYMYEGVAFEAYAQAAGPGHLTLERFYNTDTHVHHYAASAEETAWINGGHAGSGWIDEGAGFTVHVPV